jgi:hypothetical protein
MAAQDGTGRRRLQADVASRWEKKPDYAASGAATSTRLARSANIHGELETRILERMGD